MNTFTPPTPTIEMISRLAALIPDEGAGPDQFAEAAKRMIRDFAEDIVGRPEQFPKTIAFMRATDGRHRTDEMNAELGRLYAEERALTDRRSA